MKATMEYQGGENFDLREMLLKGRKLRLTEKAQYFTQFVDADLGPNKGHGRF